MFLRGEEISWKIDKLNLSGNWDFFIKWGG